MKRFLTTVSAFQLYHVIRYSALIVTGIVFTKTSLTQSDIGQWEMFMLLGGALTFFWLNGLLKALLISIPPKEDGTVSVPPVFTVFVLISVLSLLSAGVLCAAGPFFSRALLNGSQVPFLPLLVAYMVIGVPSNLVEYIYLLRSNSTRIVQYGIFSFLFQLVLVLVPALSGMGIKAAVAGLVFSMVVRYGWLVGLMLRTYPVKFSLSGARQLLVLAWPLIGATLLSGSAQYVDGFIISSRFDQEVLALFQYGARELPLAVLLANALSTSLLPAFSDRSRLAENLRELKRNTRHLMHLLFPLTLLLLVIAHPVFPVLFNRAFAGSATIFNLYLLLVISRLVFPQTILTGMNQTRSILAASLFELVLNVAVSLWLVRWMGIAGVAAGTVVAYFFEKLLLAGMVFRKLGVGPGEYIPLKLLGLYSAMVAVVFFLVERMAV